ncbi:PE-PPE domain-containing protein [Mycolicibacterium baixiangningiae]|uniref:PE-PPE domain-containing protein n=1 Tax=Mycolicibacterium baixiangningiae TaxID=2761578 RepID=UPI001E5E91E9|nr:PE-PPE domain-containing protein [Mycolicibacterium baixiangningiae]
MRLAVRFVGIAVLTILATILMALTSTTSSMYALAATTYMLPGSFGYPFGDQEKSEWATRYITATTGSGTIPPLDIVYWPLLPTPPASVESGSVVFGYSQGAYSATIYKRNFNRQWANDPSASPDVGFVVLANPGRPNGGVNTRLFLGATPTQTVGADIGQTTTYDIVRQYDAAGDFPTNPLNWLAVANANAGLVFLHAGYGDLDWADAVYQGTDGDTAYYMFPTPTLPLLMPLRAIPGVGPVLADSMEPVLRVIVEAGYDRTKSPGTPTPFNVFYFPDPVTFVNDLRLAAMAGADKLAEGFGTGLASDTEEPGVLGISGTPVGPDSTVSEAEVDTVQSGVETEELEPGSADVQSGPGPDTSTVAADGESTLEATTAVESADAASLVTIEEAVAAATTIRQQDEPAIRMPLGRRAAADPSGHPFDNTIWKKTLGRLTGEHAPEEDKPSPTISPESDDGSTESAHEGTEQEPSENESEPSQ